jgi:integrase
MTMRGRHEGSIFQRSNGRWVAMLSLAAGQRKSFYGRTRQEVQRKLAAAQRDVEMGIPVISDRQTLAQYLLGWLETTKPTIEFSSWNRNRQYVELHIIPQVGQIRLRELTAQQVQQLYTNRINAGLSSSTVRHLHATLHKALKDAERLGLVVRNVCKLVNAPRMAETEIHPLSPPQAQVLLRTVAGGPIEPLYVTALATGMRLSELLGLFWADVDLDARPTAVIRVRRQLKRVAGAWAWMEPKTKRSRRQIALPESVAGVLRRHQLRQAAERQRLGSLWEDNDLVFCTQMGRPLMPGNVYRQLMRVLKRAGLPHIRFHDLRHTAATLLLSARVNPKVVSEMLGHASTTITLDIYSHVLPDMQQDAAEAMGHLLFTEHAQHIEHVSTPTAPTSTMPPVAPTLTPQVSPTTQHDLLSDLLSTTSSSTNVLPQ